MKQFLLEVLACPACHGSLILDASSERDGELWAGSLECEGCRRTYPIRDGIPRFVQSADDVARHFEQEFLAFVDQDSDLDDPDLLEYYFLTRTGIDPTVYDALPLDAYRTSLPDDARFEPDFSALDHGRILDAGCGPGRFTRVVGSRCPNARVVGLELGGHVDRAAARSSDLPNVSFVQGSVLAPPLKRSSFDYVFTLGVLHHTPDPSGGVVRLADLVAAEGSLTIWVYPPTYWGRGPQRVVNKFVHRRLSKLPPRRGFAVCRRWLYPVGRAQMHIARRRLFKALAAPLFLVSIPRHPRREVMIATIYDYFCPPLISTHSYEEVETWLQQAGFRRLRKLPVPVSWAASERVTPRR